MALGQPFVQLASSVLVAMFGDETITSTSNERQKRSQYLAPVLVIISENSLVFSRRILPALVFTSAAPPARQHH